MSASVDVAIVIPVLRDTAALGRLLHAVSLWARRPQQIVVVDAENDGEVRALCSRHACLHRTAAANRGAQLDLGAREAGASVVWFVHADAQARGEALLAVADAVERGAESGCFRFRFEGERTAMKRIIEVLVALRIRCGGMAYGDQGIFVRRDLYLRSGGFPHEPLFEEVPLLGKLRARGTFRVIDGPFYVSSHRWERDGYLRRSLYNRWMALCYAFGVPIRRLNAAYRASHRELGDSGR